MIGVDEAGKKHAAQKGQLERTRRLGLDPIERGHEIDGIGLDHVPPDGIERLDRLFKPIAQTALAFIPIRQTGMMSRDHIGDQFGDHTIAWCLDEPHDLLRPGRGMIEGRASLEPALKPRREFPKVVKQTGADRGGGETKFRASKTSETGHLIEVVDQQLPSICLYRGPARNEHNREGQTQPYARSPGLEIAYLPKTHNTIKKVKYFGT